MSLGLVTVFGGAGFIGRYLVKRLAERGVRVRVALRRPDEGLFLKPMGAVGQIDLVAANLRHAPSVQRAVAGADAVVNCVGILYPSGAQTFQAVHTRGPALIARASAEAGVRRLVHISAIGADPQSPSVYGRTKAAGEAALREAFPDATVLRPSVVFGPEDGFLNMLANMARYTPALPMFGGGRNRMQPVYVGDVAEALLRSLTDPAATGRTYELGGPNVYTFRELLQFICEATGRRRLLVPVPLSLAMALATFTGLLPFPPLTRDQVRLLQIDNVASPDMPGLGDLGIQPQPVESAVETYLFRYRRGGQKVAPRFG